VVVAAGRTWVVGQHFINGSSTSEAFSAIWAEGTWTVPPTPPAATSFHGSVLLGVAAEPGGTIHAVGGQEFLPATIRSCAPTPAPKPNVVSIAQTSAYESTAVTKLRYAVTLSRPAPVPITADYRVRNGSSDPPPGFAPRTGSVVIPAGETTAGIGVLVQGSADGTRAKVIVELTGVSGGAVLGADLGVGFVLDSVISRPRLDVGAVRVVEGDEGSTLARFTVSLSAPKASDLILQASVEPISATEGSDYESITATLRIPAGKTFVAFNVRVLGDTVHEGPESFRARITKPSGRSITADALIMDDDP